MEEVTAGEEPEDDCEFGYPGGESLDKRIDREQMEKDQKPEEKEEEHGTEDARGSVSSNTGNSEDKETHWHANEIEDQNRREPRRWLLRIAYEGAKYVFSEHYRQHPDNPEARKDAPSPG